MEGALNGISNESSHLREISMLRLASKNDELSFIDIEYREKYVHIPGSYSIILDILNFF